MPSFEDDKIQENVCVELRCVVEKNPEAEVVQKPNVIPKEEIKKVIQKKEIAVKAAPILTPVVKEEIKPQEEIVEEKLAELQIVEKTQEIQITQENIQKVTAEKQSIQEENPHAKEVRIANEYIDEYLKQLVKLLEDNLYYPRSARKRGVEGSVVVKFVLSTDATARSIEVISSSSEILSRAAVQTIENLSGKFPKPKEDVVLNVPVKYDLKR